MPIPKTRNVGSTIKFLKREKPSLPQKQKVAIGLDIARKAGAKLPFPKNREGLIGINPPQPSNRGRQINAIKRKIR